jgi:hypothetical protein
MAALRARRDGRGCRACGGRGVRLQTHDCGRRHRHKRTPAIATEPRPGRVGSRAGRTRHSKRRSAVAAEPPSILVFTAAVGAGHRRLLSCLAGAKPTTSRLVAPLSPVVGLFPGRSTGRESWPGPDGQPMPVQTLFSPPLRPRHPCQRGGSRRRHRRPIRTPFARPVGGGIGPAKPKLAPLQRKWSAEKGNRTPQLAQNDRKKRRSSSSKRPGSTT